MCSSSRSIPARIAQFGSIPILSQISIRTRSIATLSTLFLTCTPHWYHAIDKNKNNKDTHQKSSCLSLNTILRVNKVVSTAPIRIIALIITRHSWSRRVLNKLRCELKMKCSDSLSMSSFFSNMSGPVRKMQVICVFTPLCKILFWSKSRFKRKIEMRPVKQEEIDNAFAVAIAMADKHAMAKETSTRRSWSVRLIKKSL